MSRKKGIQIQVHLGSSRGDQILKKYLGQRAEGSSFGKEVKKILIAHAINEIRNECDLTGNLTEVEIYKKFCLGNTLKNKNHECEKDALYYKCEEGEKENEEESDSDDNNFDITDI